jgi:uncharacterized protein YcfJ
MKRTPSGSKGSNFRRRHAGQANAKWTVSDRAVAAALRMREAMRRLNAERGREDLLLKIRAHERHRLEDVPANQVVRPPRRHVRHGVGEHGDLVGDDEEIVGGMLGAIVGADGGETLAGDGTELATEDGSHSDG